MKSKFLSQKGSISRHLDKPKKDMSLDAQTQFLFQQEQRDNERRKPEAHQKALDWVLANPAGNYKDDMINYGRKFEEYKWE